MGVDGSLQTLLDISGHEIYSAIFTSIREVSVTLTILIAALVQDNVELKHVGYMFLVNMIVFFIFNVTYIAYMGFWRKYYSGLIFSFALAVSSNRKRAVLHAFCFLAFLATQIISLFFVHHIYTPYIELKGTKKYHFNIDSIILWIFTNLW
jgi:hypothetical protein